MIMTETFEARVAVTLSELVAFGAAGADRSALARHLLAVACKDDVGNIDTSEAYYNVVGTIQNTIIFQVHNLKIIDKSGEELDSVGSADSDFKSEGSTPVLPKNILTEEPKSSIVESLKSLFGF